MGLAEKIARIDAGETFGEFGPDGKDFYQDRTGQHLEPILQHLRGSASGYLHVADVGGGNGILARELRHELEEHLNVTVLDIDTTKFRDDRHIDYIQHDVREPFPDMYGVTMARNVLHYNTYEAQRDIVENMANATMPGGLVAVIQSAPQTDQQDDVNALHRWLTEQTDSNSKHWSTGDEIIDMLPGEVEVETFDKTFSLEGFYQQRYNLDDDQLDEARKILGSEEVYLPTYRLTAVIE